MSYSAKRFKSFICTVLALVLVFGSVVVLPPQEVEATAAAKKPKVSYSKNERCGVGMRYRSTASIELTQNGYTVKKIKSSSKDLVVKRTYESKDSNHNNGVKTYDYYTNITFYAKKAGKYKISFDIVKPNGKKSGKTKTITVNAAGTGAVITGAKIGGENMMQETGWSSHYTTKKKGKVKFNLAKGCKIKNITATTRAKNGKEVTKKFKNGKSITLGTYATKSNSNYSYESPYSDYGYNSSYWSQGFVASTRFVITYTDSYSTKPKELRTATFDVYRQASKWVKPVYTDY